MSDSTLNQIMVLQELVLLNLNMQMIPNELEIQGTPLRDKERLKVLEEKQEDIKNEFVKLYDQLWATCQSKGLYVKTTKSYAYTVLHEITFEILPIPANGKYDPHYAIVSNKPF